jgi:sugar phosphate permease
MHYAWIVAFTGLVVVLFAHGFGRMSYSVILPYMKDALSLTYAQVGMIATGNLVGYLLSTTFGGFLASRFGPRRVISISLLVTGAGLFLTGFSHSFSFALITRLITGIGNGGCFVPTMALPAAWFVARKRGLAMGIVNIGVCLGLTLSGFLLPVCMDYFGRNGWRYAWWLMGIGVFLISYFCYALLRNSPAEKGVALCGSDGAACEGPPEALTLLSAFRLVVRESEVWKLAAVYVMYGFSYIIYLTFIVAYLTREMGLSSKGGGAIFAMIGIIAIFGGLLWGLFSDAFGRRHACISIYLVLAFSYALPAFFHGTLVFSLSAAMFGIAFSVPVLMAAAAGDAVGGRLAPAALGLITLMFAVAQTLGPFVGGRIKDATGSFTYAFMLCTIFALGGALFSMLLRRTSYQRAIGNP